MLLSILSKTITLVLLLLSLFLTLLILLSPLASTANRHLSLFSLAPTGEQRVYVQPTRVDHTASWKGREAALAVVLFNKTTIPHEAATGQTEETGGAVKGGMWLGANGPSVYVGLMRKSTRLKNRTDK